MDVPHHALRLGAGHSIFGFVLRPSDSRSARIQLWRKREDSNLRDPFGSTCFQDRPDRPLWHASVDVILSEVLWLSRDMCFGHRTDGTKNGPSKKCHFAL